MRVHKYICMCVYREIEQDRALCHKKMCLALQTIRALVVNITGLSSYITTLFKTKMQSSTAVRKTVLWGNCPLV